MVDISGERTAVFCVLDMQNIMKYKAIHVVSVIFFFLFLATTSLVKAFQIR